MPGSIVLSDKNIRGEFFKRLDLAEAGTWSSRLSMEIQSDQEIETYNWLGMPPVMREWIGGRHERPLRKEVYTIQNKVYEATESITVDDIRRDRTGQIMQRIGEMATRTATHWDALMTQLIIDNTACYDGQDFFSATHSSGDSGTHKNLVTVTEIPSAVVTDETAPTPTDIANIIVELIQHMYSFTDDTNEPINQNAMAFDVMVPTSFMAATLQALKTQFLTNGISNPLASLGDFRIGLIVNARLDWTDELALFRSDGQSQPFIRQNEVGVVAEFESDEFRNRRRLFGVNAVRNVGYGVWQGAIKVTLST